MQGCRQDTCGHTLNTLAYSSICDHSGLPGQVDSPTGVTYNDNVSMEGYRVGVLKWRIATQWVEQDSCGHLQEIQLSRLLTINTKFTLILSLGTLVPGDHWSAS